VRTEAPLPIADAGWIDSAARRTRILRLGLAAALVVALAAALFTAPRHPGRRYLPANAVGVVVLDVSSSVRPSTYFRIEQALDVIAGTKSRLGLVLFSDTAYEAFPTGTPAADLKSLLRFFAPPPKDASGNTETYLAGSPWQQWFSAGTRISQGLYLAQHMLDVEHARDGAVLLISDLADDPHDVAAVKDAVVSLEQRSVPIEIVALDPTQQNVYFWKALLGPQAIFRTASLPTGAQARGKLEVTSGFAVACALCAILVVLLLGLNEWLVEPFRFSRGVAA
jgi:hypothetical protein